MKYGQIICDPASEEAKALVGKKVVASDNYSNAAAPFEACQYLPVIGKLVDLRRNECNPFLIEESDGIYQYTFIREVIEDKPKYRPYENTDEMVNDFKKRFCSNTTIPKHSMPLVWLKDDLHTVFLVTAFSKEYLLVGSLLERLDEVFKNYTYLDGSPVGKEAQ